MMLDPEVVDAAVKELLEAQMDWNTAQLEELATTQDLAKKTSLAELRFREAQRAWRNLPYLPDQVTEGDPSPIIRNISNA